MPTLDFRATGKNNDDDDDNNNNNNNNNYYYYYYYNYNRLVGLFGHEIIIVFLLFYVSKKLYM